MRVFGRSFGEYISFEKYFLILVAAVGILRFVLDKLNVPDSNVKWVSITGILFLGALFYSVYVYTSGFGRYGQLWFVLLLQWAVGVGLIILGIVLGILTHKDNIFTKPEYAGNQDGKNWIHAASHVAEIFIGATILWIVGCLIMFIVSRLSPRKVTA